MITTTAPDGSSVRAHDEGRGPVILLLHGGMDDGASWARVAARLRSRFRVLRLHRRQYRLDLKTGEACTMAEEVEHVHALVELIGEPVLIVGHSSGGVLALESLVALPGAFAGAVLYEPPCVIGPPLGGEALTRAQAAVTAGKPGRALAIFLRDIVRAPAWAARMSGATVPLLPRLGRLAAHQLHDCAAIDEVGLRLDAYAGIDVPVVLLGGERSPAHLGERLDALERAMPNTERVRLRRQGHAANSLAPARVAEVIAGLGDEVLRTPSP
jgi:pimeloyl-ACP methyl ester carboxylesterase